VLAG
jgi:hypothetical protein